MMVLYVFILPPNKGVTKEMEGEGEGQIMSTRILFQQIMNVMLSKIGLSPSLELYDMLNSIIGTYDMIVW